MEFELMIPFGVVIIIFATIICRKYIFIKKSDEDIITCDEGEDNFKINKNYSEDIARINIVDYKENNSEDTMEDLVRERDYDDYSRSMEESIIKTSARYYEEKKEKEEEERKLKEKEHEKENNSPSTDTGDAAGAGSHRLSRRGDTHPHGEPESERLYRGDGHAGYRGMEI